MTVEDLINHLISIPPEFQSLPVFINGYEGGFSSLDTSQIQLETILQVRPDNYDGYYGMYEVVSPEEIKHQKEFMENPNEPFKAIVIDRNAIPL